LMKSKLLAFSFMDCGLFVSVLRNFSFPNKIKLKKTKRKF
jgi:hypothetical protein